MSNKNRRELPDAPEFNTTVTAKPTLNPLPTAPEYNNTPTDLPTINPLPTGPQYDSSTWDESAKGQAALGAYNTAKDNVNNYGDFTYADYEESAAVKNAGAALDQHLANKPGAYQSQWQSQLDALMNQIMNRDKFSYDMNGDALYQQYKDKYVQQGKMAMADTMGQAAAMTGGYGSSYAQSVGQQAYQGQLQNLNDIVPELYSMALDQYNREGQELYNQYGLVADRDATDYGRHRDSVSDWQNDRNYLQGRYDSERNFDYGKYVDDRGFAHDLHQEGYQRLMDALGIARDDYYDGANLFNQDRANRNEIAGREFDDAMAIWGAESDQAWKNYDASETARLDANNLLHQGFQDSMAIWDAESDQAWKNYDASETARRDVNNLLQKGYENELGVWDRESDEYWKEEGRDLSERELAMKEEAWDIEKAKYGVTFDENGNVVIDDTKPVVPVEPTGSKVTPEIRKKAGEFKSNEALASWAEGLVASGAISVEEADALVAEFMDYNEIYIETVDEAGNKTKKISYKDMVSNGKGWSVVDNGGANLFGIDEDAKVETPNGETITLKNLKQKLIAEGMTKSEAKKVIKQLQQNLGISSNGFFGL